MKCTLERMGEIVANAKLRNHTHIRMVPSENRVYTGHKIPNGWQWIGVEL